MVVLSVKINNNYYYFHIQYNFQLNYIYLFLNMSKYIIYKYYIHMYVDGGLIIN